MVLVLVGDIFIFDSISVEFSILNWNVSLQAKKNNKEKTVHHSLHRHRVLYIYTIVYNIVPTFYLYNSHLFICSEVISII